MEVTVSSATDGNPLPGVSVTFQGGMITDVNGMVAFEDLDSVVAVGSRITIELVAPNVRTI